MVVNYFRYNNHNTGINNNYNNHNQPKCQYSARVKRRRIPCDRGYRNDTTTTTREQYRHDCWWSRRSICCNCYSCCCNYTLHSYAEKTERKTRYLQLKQWKRILGIQLVKNIRFTKVKNILLTSFNGLFSLNFNGLFN